MIKVNKFIGAIAFLDSKKEDRRTAVMDFEIAAEWFNSVKEFFAQEVMTGNYDGTEVLVNVYEYGGKKGIYSSISSAEFIVDTDNLVVSKSIMNPYYV